MVVDEVYLEFLEGEVGQTSFHLADNIIVISSLTKVFGLAGLRCGWILRKDFDTALVPGRLFESPRRFILF